ncbi:MAG: dihydropteroate synthase [Pseudohongiella sp.]|nr:dihydropteroate synthase [Pseudohongiella sp.]
MSGRWLELSVPRVMGILNVTPDSFSDGGLLSVGSASQFKVSLDKALFAVQSMVSAGVDIIDVGGESTRPGAPDVSENEELERVIPVVTAIRANFDVLISVDTSTPSVITASAMAGADMINDVRALQRHGALEAAAATDLAVCLMHMQGEPQFMQQAPSYIDVFNDVSSFLSVRKNICERAGIHPDRICLDPGFGFGKTLAHNYQLLSRLHDMHALGSPLLIGLSRKSMIGAVLGAPAADRLAGSLAGAVLAAAAGAQIIRVHDVEPTVHALKVLSAMRNAGQNG